MEGGLPGPICRKSLYIMLNHAFESHDKCACKQAESNLMMG